MIATPGHPSDVQDVTGAVERLRLARAKQAAAEEGVLGLLLRGCEQPLEPLRLGKRVGVQERDPLAVGRTLDGAVVPGREADVLLEAQDFDAGMPGLEPVRGAICRCVVDDDRARRPNSLAREGVQAAVEDRRAVQIDDDDGDPWPLIRLHTVVFGVLRPSLEGLR